MATTRRSDLANQMYDEAKAVFKKNMKDMPVQEWKGIVTAVEKSTKMEEFYDTVGNLKPASVKAEEEAITYGKIKSVNRTTVKNVTYGNGFSVSMEAKEDERKGVINEAKMNELGRTMHMLREDNCADIFDTVKTSIGADGVAFASNSHPLQDTALVNDNLIEKAFTISVYEEAVQQFREWKNHYGQKFYTKPDKVACHTNREVYIMQMLQSTLRPFEESNTINGTYKLKFAFNQYIEKLPLHMIDTSIKSFIMQRRKNITTEYDYDKRSTFNWYFNIHERYRFAIINPGFGFITIDGVDPA